MSDTIQQMLRKRLAEAKARNASQEEIAQEIAWAQEALDAESAKDPERKRTGWDDLGSAARTFSDAQTFGVSGLLEDALSSGQLGAPNLAKFREARDSRKRDKAAVRESSPLLSTAAELVGSVATPIPGGAVLKGAKTGAGLLKTGAYAAREGALQGFLAGMGENIGTSDDPTGLKSGVMGGTVGGAAGGVLGTAAAKIAQRGVPKANVRPGAREVARELEQAPDVARVYEFDLAGKGNEAMPADAMGPEGASLLRSAMNVSPKGRAVASERVRLRDTNIGERATKDLGDAAGLNAEQVATATSDLIAKRKAAAAPLYDAAEQEAANWAYALSPKAKKALQAFGDSEAGAKVLNIVRGYPQFQHLADDDPRLWQEAYKLLSVNEGKVLDAEGSLGQWGRQAARALKDALRIPLGEATPTYLKAVETFADESAPLAAYQRGVELFGKPAGETAAAKAATAVGDQPMLVKGALDRSVQAIRQKAPNADLGEAGKAASRVGQQAVGTMESADVWKSLIPPDKYDALVKKAKAEGAFSRTSNAATGGSTTAAQTSDIGDLLGVAGALGSSIAVNPSWMAAMFGRRLAGEEMNRIARGLSKKRGEKIATALTDAGGGEGFFADLLKVFEEDAARNAAGRGAARTAGAVGGRYAGGKSQR